MFVAEDILPSMSTNNGARTPKTDGENEREENADVQQSGKWVSLLLIYISGCNLIDKHGGKQTLSYITIQIPM